MVAPQVVIGLAIRLEKSPEAVFDAVSRFCREKLKAELVLDLWEGI